MKKTIKLALVLSTIALVAVSCSVQTYSLVGYYTNGKTGAEEFTMLVNDNGEVRASGFDIYDTEYSSGQEIYTPKTPSNTEESFSRLFAGSYGSSSIFLVPWDLATSKIGQEYNVKAKFRYLSEKVTITPGGSSMDYIDNHIKDTIVDVKFVFTMKGDNIECKVTLSGVPEGKGQNGEVTLTKRIK